MPSRPNHRRPLFAGFALALILPLGACGDSDTSEGDTEETAVPVAVAPVTRDRIAATYKGTATIESPNEATVVSKLAGVLQAIAVEEGQTVEAGTVLARLDDERLRLELDRARAQFQRLSKELERSEQLSRQKLLSPDERDRKRYEHAAAKADLELAELNLRESVIRAPIAGVVSAREAKVGNMVQPHQALFRITDLSALEARLHVPEREMRKLAVGQHAQLEIDTWPGERFVGRVLRLNPVVDAATGTVKVTLGLDNATGKLRPGMFGRFRVEYDSRPDALLIPKDAVIIEDANAFVFVIEDGKARRRRITLGFSDPWHHEVLDGLAEGDEVVTIGRASLKDGAPAQIVETRGS